MTPYEILLSESQERMLLVARAGREDAVARDLRALGPRGRGDRPGHRRRRLPGALARRGGVRAAGRARSPTRRRSTTGRPRSRRGSRSCSALDLAASPEPERLRRRRCCALLESPNLVLAASGSTASTTSSSAATPSCGPGADAAVVRVEGTRQRARAHASTATAATARSIRTSARCSRWSRRRATSSRRAREPLGVTDCLNFGNPEKPGGHVAVPAGRSRGIRDACLALGTPVVSGNVSFYNETDGRSIPPTPTIAMVGLLDDVEPARSRQWFKSEGDVDRAARPHARGARRQRVPGASMHGMVRGTPPWIDLEAEKRLQRVVLEAIARAACCARRTTSREGGLAVALAECCIPGRRAGSAPRSSWKAAMRPRRAAVRREPVAHAAVGAPRST